MRNVLGLLALLLLGCNRDPLPGPGGVDLAGVLTDAAAPIDGGTWSPTGSFISRECAPNDGPAIQVLLYSVAVPECSADMSRRSIRIYLYSGADMVLPITAPVTITSTENRMNGSVTDCPGGKLPCLTTSDFTVTFDAFTDKGPARGRVTERFPTGEVTAAFDATFCEFAPPMCG